MAFNFHREPPGWLAVAVAALLLAGCGGARSRYEIHLQKGQQFLAAGNLDKASIEFRNAAQIQPKEADPLYFNGRVAEARGNLREAVGLYNGAIEYNPEHADARAHLGKLLIFSGAAQRGIDTIAPALTAHPDDPDLLAARAAARHQLKQDPGAWADAERALAVSPTNEDAVAVLATLDRDAGDPEKAIALVDAAVARAPRSSKLREVLANLYLSSGQPQKAVAQMREIINLQPAELSPRAQLAVFLARTHDLDGAQHVLEEAVAAFTVSKDRADADEAKLLLADFIASQRSRDAGEKILRGYIAQDADNMDLRLGLGALLQRTGSSADALRTYREIVQRDGTAPKALIARDRMAAIEAQLGHEQAAGTLLREVLQKNPRDDDALALRADLELRDNDPASAVADLRTVLRDHPSSIDLQRMLAKAYVAKGDVALAEETLRTLLQTAPDAVPARIELAQLFDASGRAAQAVSVLQETVALVPDSIPAREALIRAYLAGRNLEAAHKAADELKARQPKSASGYYLAGLVSARQGRIEDSERSFQQALQLQPRDLNALAALVRSEMSRGAYDRAIGRVQTAVDADPDNPHLLNLLGGLLLERKDFARAADAFSKASTTDPRQWQAHRNLALVKVALNDPDAAADEYRAALKLGQTDPQLVADVATFYEKRGRVDDAIAAYEGLYRDDPRSRQFAANNLAMLIVTYKTDKSSLDRARELTSSFTSSRNSQLLDTVGWVHFKRGEYKEALPLLERAVAGAPDSGIMKYHLAMDELQLGLRDRARTNLESALSGTAEFTGSDQARTTLASLSGRAG